MLCFFVSCKLYMFISFMTAMVFVSFTPIFSGDISIYWILIVLSEMFYNPPSTARGGLKENGQNPDSGSKNSENQNNDAIS